VLLLQLCVLVEVEQTKAAIDIVQNTIETLIILENLVTKTLTL